MTQKKRVAIIGAGWAGLAAAVELVDRGFHVEVFEASRTLGGRARSLEWNGLTIDNGQHILIGAYTETLRLMRKVGVDPDKALMRMPLTLCYPHEGFRLVAPRLPAPFHTAFALALAQGLSWPEKWAAMRLMWNLKRTNYRVNPDITVAEWLDRHKTPPRQRRLIWEPLCISALNTPAERASAQVMANVVCDSLDSGRWTSDMLIPRIPLSECFPEPAARYIEKRGGGVIRGQRVKSLVQRQCCWTVDDTGAYDHAIIATAPYHAATLLPEVALEVSHFEYEPIVTTYLQYSLEARLPFPMLGVAGSTAQWLFDRGHYCTQPGLIAAVISSRGGHLDQDKTKLEQAVQSEITQHAPECRTPEAILTVIEQRATFSCTPSLFRPTTASRHETKTATGSMPYLAGDYIAGRYPGTLEGAVRAGVQAASATLGASGNG